MASWDQGIHRIQEIQQLLEDRQRYFCGQLNTSCYKIDKKGNPVFFPTLNSTPAYVAEPSLGHSVEAHHGSSENNERISALHLDNDSDSEGRGNDADASSDSSDENAGNNEEDTCTRRDASMKSGEELQVFSRKKKDNPKKSRRKSNAKELRKWVHENVEQGLSLDHKRPSIEALRECLKTPRPSTAFRRKSVTFEETNKVTHQKPSENDVRRSRRRMKKYDPIEMLKKRSSILRTEIASRLGDQMDIGFLNNVTQSSLMYAREKLKRAEKSLQDAVKTAEQPIPIRTAIEVRKPVRQAKVSDTSEKPKSLKMTFSRLHLRHEEEALKSDQNLREAFALIKINPDPILKLKSVEKKTLARPTPSGEQKNSKKSSGSLKKDNLSYFSEYPSATDASLKHLTRLSLQHKQKQKALIPERLQSGRSSVDTITRNKSPKLAMRRKSSSFSQQKDSPTRIGSKDNHPHRRGSKVVSSSFTAGAGGKTKGLDGDVNTSSHQRKQSIGYYSVTKLTGTVL